MAQNLLKKIFILTFLCSTSLFAQQNITGNVYSENGEPLAFATVVLLSPVDSTLVNFCITDSNGNFELKKVTRGNYILQTGFVGFKNSYRDLEITPNMKTDLGTIVLTPISVDLGEVTISAEKIPFLVKGDTIEYNALSFRTRPDDVAEDLLRKLPGIEVDKAGNIKALGEDVKNILVDGKEFFGSDPKVATKNLSAESINKVQVYNKRTDEAELLGIEDDNYDKTINLILKDGMKQAIFGDVKAGSDFIEHYSANVKVYRFTKTQQFAALGMLNNVNRTGFSFQDYFDFTGGIRNMAGGSSGAFSFSMDNSMPVDFGQSVNGRIKSGAGGLNFTHEFAKENRFNISYMGNGSNRNLEEIRNRHNFTEQNQFEQNTEEESLTKNRNHLFNVGWRNKSDSIRHFTLNGSVTIANNSSNSQTITDILRKNQPVNSIINDSESSGNRLVSSASYDWLRKMKGNWVMLKTTGNFNFSGNISDNEWTTFTTFYNQLPPVPVEENWLGTNKNNRLNGEVSLITLHSIGKGLYIEPNVRTGLTFEELNREQISMGNVIDSLSPLIINQYLWVRPDLAFRIYKGKTRINIGVGFEAGELYNNLNNSVKYKQNISKLLPRASWNYEYSAGRRLNLTYRTSLNNPNASQLQPIISNTNPLMILRGNSKLKPEYRHNLTLHWSLFDQFSFTSVFANISAGYTKDKINQSINVSDDLKQEITLENVPEDYVLSGGINFSTPIRPLKINVKLGLRERYNQGINKVNGVFNYNTNLSHQIQLSFDNRKKEKWDIEIGGRVNVTNSRYSIQNKLDNQYLDYTAFTDIRFTPTDSWFFGISGDYTSYSDKSFSEKIEIPIIGAQINYNFLKGKRAQISLECYDLLDKNKGLTRSGSDNYLQEVRSNTIGRFILLSFKYRLNKSAMPGSGMRIQGMRR